MRIPTVFLAKLWLSSILAFLVSASVWADEEPLDAGQAFELASARPDADAIRLSWNISSGYYLYRQKFKFVSLTPGTTVGAPQFPTGQTWQDSNLGRVEIYRDHLELELPLRRQDDQSATLRLEITYQGCADSGFCYLPIHKTLEFDRPIIPDAQR